MINEYMCINHHYYIDTTITKSSEELVTKHILYNVNVGEYQQHCILVHMTK